MAALTQGYRVVLFDILDISPWADSAYDCDTDRLRAGSRDSDRDRTNSSQTEPFDWRQSV